jgi:hypothetical protein
LVQFRYRGGITAVALGEVTLASFVTPEELADANARLAAAAMRPKIRAELRTIFLLLGPSRG